MEIFWLGTAIFVAIGLVLVITGEVLLRVQTDEDHYHHPPH